MTLHALPLIHQSSAVFMFGLRKGNDSDFLSRKNDDPRKAGNQ